MKRLLILALFALVLSTSWGERTALAAPAKPCTFMYVRTDVGPLGTRLYGTGNEDYVFAGERVCFRGEVDAPLGYAPGEYYLYSFRVEVEGMSGWIPETWLTTSRPQVWPQAYVTAEWPQMEQDGSRSWVQRWTDGSYVSWTIEEALFSYTTSSSVVREYPQLEADGSISWVQEWSDGSFTSTTIQEAKPASLGAPQQGRQWARVTYVVDGDTFEAVIGESHYRVRLFGVDTPEWGQVCYYEAKDAATRFLEQGVYLESDVRDTDNYGRLLRYAFDPEGLSIDAALVSGGYGYAWRRDGKYRDWIVGLESEARSSSVGCLWGS